MKKQNKVPQLAVALALILALCLSPVSALASAIDPPAGAVVSAGPDATVPDTSESTLDESIPATPALNPETPAVPSVDGGDALATPTENDLRAGSAITYMVEYRVDGATVGEKTEGLAAGAAFPAPPSAYTGYTWTYTDNSGNTLAFVWGGDAQPATVGARNWVLEGTAPAAPTLGQPGDLGTNDEAGTYTVFFWNAFVDANNPVDTVIVNEGGTVSLPAAPSLPEGKNAFLGWYESSTGDGPAFDFDTAIHANLNLYAIFSDNFIVNFLDDTGKVILSREIASGGTVAAPDHPPQVEGKVFLYWYVFGENEDTPFSFATPIEQNLVLAPKYGTSHYVFFDSNGGKPMAFPENGGLTYLPVEVNTAVAQPENPTRNGYTFVYWSTDLNATPEEKGTAKKYDFSAPVTDTFTLYAVWQANPVAYKLVYWHEVANYTGDPGINVDNYTYSATVPVTAANSAFKAGYTPTEAELKALAASHYTAAANKNKPLTYSEYAFAPQVTLSGNGDTIINVYYKRIVYEITMDLNRANAYIELNGKKYYNNTYTFKGKYEQDIRGGFPQDQDVHTAANDKYVIDGWKTVKPNVVGTTETPHSALTVLPEYMIPTTGRTYTMQAQWRTASSSRYMWRQTYLTLTTEEAKELADSGKIPVEITDTTAPFPTGANSAENPYEYIQYKGVVYRWSSYYTVEGYAAKDSNGGGYNYGYVTGAIRKTDSAETWGDLKVLAKNDANTEAVLYLLYTRVEIRLTLDPMGGSLAKPGTAWQAAGSGWATQMLFGTNVEAAVKAICGGEIPTPTLPQENMEFLGWFVNVSDDAPFTSSLTAPSDGLTLFAKYQKTDFTVTFYQKVDGALMETKSVGEGAVVDPPRDHGNGSLVYEVSKGYDGLGMFLGWGVMVPGTSSLTPYNITAGVYKTLELYGRWQTAGFTVTYDVNGGTGATPQDPNTYDLGALAPVKAGEGLTGANGEVFVGWRASDKGAIYYPGSILKMNGSVTLKAYYAQTNSLASLTYHSNVAGAEATITDTVAKGEPIALRGEGTFTRQGYRLIGWATEKAAATPDYSLPAEHPGIDQDTTLYAVWEKLPTFTVTYKIGAGSEDLGKLEGEQSMIVVRDIPKDSVWNHSIIEPTTVPKANCVFLGWFTQAGDPFTPPHFVQADHTVYARFAIKINFAEAIDIGADPAAAQKTYGEDDPDKAGWWSWNEAWLTANVYPYMSDSVFKNDFTVAAAREAGEDAGKYDITVTVTAVPVPVGRYSTSELVVTGKEAFTIEKKALILYANSLPDGDDILYPTSPLPAFTAHVDPRPEYGFANGDTTLEYSLYLTDYSGSGTPPAGTYTLGFSVPEDAHENRNYNIFVVNGTVTITAPAGETATVTPETPVTPIPPAPAVPVAEVAAFEPEAPLAAVLQPEAPPLGAQQASLPEEITPLAAQEGQWALLNLMVAVLALVLGLLLIATLFLRGKKRGEAQAAHSRKTGLLWRILAIAAGVLAPIIFLLTENIRNQMVFADHWTLLMVSVLVAQFVAMLLWRHAHSRENDAQEQAGEA